jgi:hypothetical protein
MLMENSVLFVCVAPFDYIINDIEPALSSNNDESLVLLVRSDRREQAQQVSNLAINRIFTYRGEFSVKNLPLLWTIAKIRPTEVHLFVGKLFSHVKEMSVFELYSAFYRKPEFFLHENGFVKRGWLFEV